MVSIQYLQIFDIYRNNKKKKTQAKPVFLWHLTKPELNEKLI